MKPHEFPEPMPAIVKPAEDRGGHIKRLHKELSDSDRNNLAKAKLLGQLLEDEHEDCLRRGYPWRKRLEELDVPHRTSQDYRDVYKSYLPGGLLASVANAGLTESYNRIRAAKKKDRARDRAQHPAQPPPPPPERPATLPFPSRRTAVQPPVPEGEPVQGENENENDATTEADQESSSTTSTGSGTKRRGRTSLDVVGDDQAEYRSYSVALELWQEMRAGKRQAALRQRAPKAYPQPFIVNDKGVDDYAHVKLRWEPVTGCQAECPYCWSRAAASRLHDLKGGVRANPVAAPPRCAPGHPVQQRGSRGGSLFQKRLCLHPG
jgi:hypothetical protein